MSLRVAVLLSGEGTTFEHLAAEQEAGRLDVEFAAVISSKSDAGGLERARRRGIPARAVPRRECADEAEFNRRLHAVIDEYRPELIVLAGFLSKLELRGYAGRVVNTHPALIPAFAGHGFYGDRVHRSVLEAGVRLTGATVHFCDDEYDTGPILAQRAVPVLDDDDLESLKRRVQECERDLYAESIQLIAQGRVQLEGRRVRIRPGSESLVSEAD